VRDCLDTICSYTFDENADICSSVLLQIMHMAPQRFQLIVL
ncbi:unnamed protein product, partial [Urochloa humidicola]